MNTHLNIIFRSIVLYIVLVFFARLMGRKQISQLTYFDYVVGISIGSIAAATAIDKRISFIDGIISLLVWSAITILISEITLRNINLRLLIDSEPLIIIDKGKVIYKNMKKARYNMGDLLMQLRNENIFYITEVEAAILEPNGKLSVLKKAEYTEITAGDMHIEKPKTGVMIELVLDGHILSSHLPLIEKDEAWVLAQLKARNINKLNEVVFAGIQADEQIYIVTKN